MTQYDVTASYDELDRILSQSPELIKADDLTAYIANISNHPAYVQMCDIKKISMLHVDTLMLLRLFALGAKGGILEIGPYVGGSTIAIASGVRAGSGARFVSIEPGGKYPDHPDYPSNDILADLRSNLDGAGLSSYVKFIEGHSADQRVRDEVFKILGDCGISFLFVDADGEIGRDMDIYRPLLQKNCIMAFDDYFAPGVEKQLRVKEIVDREVAIGRLESLGMFRWGTWFGRFRGG